ncbi:MAG: type II toxin-antitoxin system RelE/ParE family toxin [Saprospiraceae bacterium]|nr:type II toxin-antitoxin system RelE/ParE family toxin [Saprospiraceae bacterium]
MAQKVVWASRATDDLYAIYESLSVFSDTRAETATEEIINQFFLLEQFPRIGRVVPELNLETIRELIVHQYRVVYSITVQEQIEVLTVRHSSRPLT